MLAVLRENWNTCSLSIAQKKRKQVIKEKLVAQIHFALSFHQIETVILLSNDKISTNFHSFRF